GLSLRVALYSAQELVLATYQQQADCRSSIALVYRTLAGKFLQPGDLQWEILANALKMGPSQEMARKITNTQSAFRCSPPCPCCPDFSLQCPCSYCFSVAVQHGQALGVAYSEDLNQWLVVGQVTTSKPTYNAATSFDGVTWSGVNIDAFAANEEGPMAVAYGQGRW